MLTAKDCLIKYGPPRKERNMVVWKNTQYSFFPTKIYMNRDLVIPLESALKLIKERGLEGQIHSFDGCFNIRSKRENPNSVSLHSWGVAIDINATSNPFGRTPTMSKELVACFEDAGFDWGGHWAKPDGTHFQLRSI